MKLQQLLDSANQSTDHQICCKGRCFGQLKANTLLPVHLHSYCWQFCLKGTSKNALFPRQHRQLRTRILMYALYTAVLRAELPCSHEKITIFKDTLK